MLNVILFVAALSSSFDPLSLQSLYLNVVTDGQYVFSATGFIVEHDSRYYLVTNQHVFTGIDFFTDTPLAPDSSIPVELHLWYHGPLLGNWTVGVESLYEDDGNPRWINHRYEHVDAAVLPLEEIPSGALVHPLDLSEEDVDPAVIPGQTLYIVGFPYGRASTGKMPIWKTAHLASEYDLDVEGARAFLVDATTREGMSGAPVVLRTFNGSSTENVATHFLGIYSAQYLDAEIGVVWRPEIITEILESIR